MLLAESWRGRVPLLYSNLELLLPVHTDLHNHAVSKTINGKHVRNISRLSRKKYNTTCDTTSSSMKQRTSLSVTVAPSRAPTSCDKIEQNTAKVETVFLDALTDFFDLMSYLDATLQGAAPLVSGSCRPEALVWTGAEIKDGLLDETNEEECRSWSQERLLNIQAAVEGLGCHKCCWRLSEVWSEARTCRQKEEDNVTGSVVAYPATSTRQELTFTVRPLCAPRWVCRPYPHPFLVIELFRGSSVSSHCFSQCMSSFTTFMNLPLGLLFLLYGNSILSILVLIYITYTSTSLHCTCPNHLNLTSPIYIFLVALHALSL